MQQKLIAANIWGKQIFLSGYDLLFSSRIKPMNKYLDLNFSNSGVEYLSASQNTEREGNLF